MNNTDLSSASGFSTSEQCGVMNVFNDPYCLWVSSGGKINGNSYVSLMFIDNSSAAYPNYPHGNTTVTMTLELFNNNYANVTAMSVNFVPASGTPINLGNSFVENYGTHVWSAVVDLAGYVGHDAQASYLSQCGTIPNYCTLGKAYMDVSEALADLTNVLLRSSLTSSFYSDNVPSVASLVMTWQWTPGCSAGTIGFAAGTVGLVVGISSGQWYTLFWTVPDVIASAYAISANCLSYNIPP